PSSSAGAWFASSRKGSAHRVVAGRDPVGHHPPPPPILGAPMNDLSVDARAPLRISFVGGGTDFPHWFERHGGAVLSATIDHYAHVRVEPRDDGRIRIRDLRLNQLVQYHVDDAPIYDGVVDLPKAAIHRIGLGHGIDLDLRNDAPPGSGLGGSSALVTAAVAALAALGENQLRDRASGPPHRRRLAGSVCGGIRGLQPDRVLGGGRGGQPGLGERRDARAPSIEPDALLLGPGTDEPRSDRCAGPPLPRGS